MGRMIRPLFGEDNRPAPRIFRVSPGLRICCTAPASRAAGRCGGASLVRLSGPAEG